LWIVRDLNLKNLACRSFYDSTSVYALWLDCFLATIICLRVAWVEILGLVHGWCLFVDLVIHWVHWIGVMCWCSTFSGPVLISSLACLLDLVAWVDTGCRFVSELMVHGAFDILSASSNLLVDWVDRRESVVHKMSISCLQAQVSMWVDILSWYEDVKLSCHWFFWYPLCQE
jgi:hypothetical protein